MFSESAELVEHSDNVNTCDV